MFKFWKFTVALVLFLASGVTLFAANPAIVRGTVTNAQGNVVPGALVTLTNSMSHKELTALTEQDGSYSISIPNPDGYTLVITKEGFQAFTQSLELHPGQMVDADAKLLVQTSQQTVTVHGGDMPGVTAQPSQQQVFDSDQSIRVIDRKQMDMVGPVAGAAQILSTAPGVNVTGYGNTGATKYTVTLNGINQGWGGYGGFTGGGSLGITFDGVPIVDPATDLWQSPTIPETGMIQNTNVTYGPGDPADRWYSNVGGAVEFTPMQPTARPSGSLTTTYGSYQQKDIVGNLSTGLVDGWSTVFSAGAGKGDDFRKAPDGFKNPGKDWAAQAKTVKAAGGNSIELAGYYAYGGGYRSQVIPTVANPNITIDGNPGTQQYSQQTSGYFSTLPFASYNKYDTNQMGLVYARETLQLDKSTTVQNLTWYMHIARSHDRYNDVYGAGTQLMEHNTPYTNTIGDKFLLTKSLPWNTIQTGGYYIHALYNSRNNFYNPADGGAKRTVNIGGKIRSSYFDQDDFSLFLQDDFHPVPIVHVIPGIRYTGFATGYSNHSTQDFTFAPGVVLSQNCPATGTSVAGNAKDQGASCGGNENRSGMEPSVDASVQAQPWLNLYGGFMEALRAPSLGGGGGLFQKIDPATYHLERGTYYQFGFKIHTVGTGVRNHLLFGAAFYHQKFANQEIDTTFANGNTISADGTSTYHGVNIYFDDDPIHNLHVFANANVEAATYNSYVVGGNVVNNVNTCNNPAPPPALISGCVDYSGSPVSYVPNSTVNAGVYYDIPVRGLTVEPTGSFQYTGSQHLFDNTVGAPSKTQSMGSFATANLGVKVPYKHLEISGMALNVLNSRYNEYEYISSGGYFSTATGGYILAYPGAPVTAYGSVSVHF